jgi:hypothetical protein
MYGHENDLRDIGASGPKHRIEHGVTGEQGYGDRKYCQDWESANDAVNLLFGVIRWIVNFGG